MDWHEPDHSNGYLYAQVMGSLASTAQTPCPGNQFPFTITHSIRTAITTTCASVVARRFFPLPHTPAFVEHLRDCTQVAKSARHWIRVHRSREMFYGR
jgi:hypothetical protein